MIYLNILYNIHITTSPYTSDIASLTLLMQNSRKRKRDQQFDSTLQKQSLIDIDYDGNVNGNDVASACIGHSNPNSAITGTGTGTGFVEAGSDITILELLAFGAAHAMAFNPNNGIAIHSGNDSTLVNLAGHDFEPCSGMTERAIEYLMRRT